MAVLCPAKCGKKYLDAQSGFKCKTRAEALEKAIQNAEKIVAEFKKMNETNFKRLTC